MILFFLSNAYSNHQVEQIDIEWLDDVVVLECLWSDRIEIITDRMVFLIKDQSFSIESYSIKKDELFVF
jgi:hypothetical protein